MNRVSPVPEGLTGLYADVGLAKLLGLSRVKTGEILAQGGMVIGETVLRKSDVLQSRKTLEVTMPIHPKACTPEVAPVPGLKLLYEDTDPVMVGKLTGVAARTELGWDRSTVAGTLCAVGVRISTSSPVECEDIMYRLDAGTSGVMVAVKFELAYGKLENALHYHRAEKIYLAVARGILRPSLGAINAPIGWASGREFKVVMAVGGKSAVAHYDTTKSLSGAALARVRLEMGRIHQIRVHSAAINHPLLGDTKHEADAEQAARLGLER